ncbi:MAG: tetratricopeptide repeat protein, partial [Sedimentisphaerales bacterium]|nr:tetratricopeptide repeat protein [Sedimentisphaerales bacterium]
AKKSEREAENILRELIVSRPSEATAVRYLAGVLFEQRRWQDTLLLTRNFTDRESRLYSARSLQQLGYPGRAEEYYLAILDTDSGDEQVISYLAGLYLADGQRDKAQELLLRSARLYPHYDLVQLEMIKFYAVISMSEPVLPYKAAGPDSAQGRFYELCSKWEIRYSDNPPKNKRARTMLQDKLEELLVSHPDCRAAQEMLCRSYLADKQLDKAQVRANWLIANSSDNYTDLQLASEVFENAGRYDNQSRTCRLIWQKHCRNASCLSAALKSARLAGEPSSALELLHEGLAELKIDAEFIRVVQPEAVNIFFVLRNYDEAIDILRKWLAASRNDISISADKLLICTMLEDLAVFETYAGDYDNAAATIRELYQSDASYSFDSLFVLTRNLNIRGYYDQSLLILDELISTLDRQDVFLYHEYAFTLIDAGRAQEAVAYIQNWQQSRPDASNRRFVLLETCQRAGYFDKAIDLLKEQLRNTPGDIELMCDYVFNLICQGSELSLHEATAVLDELERNQADPYKWFDYRIILDINAGNSELAFDRLLAMGADPGSVATRMLQARISFLSGDSQRSAELYYELLNADPNNPEYLSQLSFVLEYAGEITDALALLEKALANDKDNAMTRNNLAYLMLVHDVDIERAGAMLREAIYQSPGNVAILDSVGWYYFKLGDYETALEYIYHAAAADTIVDPEVMEHLGDCLEKLGDIGRARLYWQRALQELDRRLVMEKYLTKQRDRIAAKLAGE